MKVTKISALLSEKQFSHVASLGTNRERVDYMASQPDVVRNAQAEGVDLAYLGYLIEYYSKEPRITNHD